MTRTSTRRPALRRRTAAAAASGAAVAATLLVAAPAQASVLVMDHYRDSGSDTVTDCGGTFQHTFQARGTFSFVVRGSSVAPYGADRGRSTETWTNPRTAKTFTIVTRYNDRDHRIVVNDDGTLTITGQHAGSSKVYDDAGQLLFHDAGVYRYQVLIDYGDTLADPDDDVFLEFLGIPFGPKGRSDTFDRNLCEDLHTYTD